MAAADETIALWAAGGLDFSELGEDIAAEVRVIRALGDSAWVWWRLGRLGFGQAVGLPGGRLSRGGGWR